MISVLDVFLCLSVTSVEFKVPDLSGLEIEVSQLSMYVYLIAEALGVNEVTSRGREHRRK